MLSLNDTLGGLGGTMGGISVPGAWNGVIAAAAELSSVEASTATTGRSCEAELVAA